MSSRRNSETCDGACLDAIDHVWDTAGGKLDLTAVKDPSNKYISKTFDGNGMPTKIVYGDSDSDPSNGGGLREVYMFYGNTSFPGRVTEVRRKSDLDTQNNCNATEARSCRQTVYTYTSDGLLDKVRELGSTLNASDQVTSYDFTTDYSYDSQGRITQIEGPLTGTDDVTVFEYWSSSDPLKDGFLQNFKRKRDSSSYVTQSSLDFDFWGNAIALQDADGTVSCQTFSASRGFLTERRETMNGQTDCTSHASDLVTTYVRDSALRLTKITRPDGSCMHYEYDTRGRFSKTKRRDDCNATSTGDSEEYTYSTEGLLTKVETKDASGTVTKRRELTYFDFPSSTRKRIRSTLTSRSEETRLVHRALSRPKTTWSCSASCMAEADLQLVEQGLWK